MAGLQQSHVQAIAQAVQRHGPFRGIAKLWRQSGVPVAALKRLAAADAFQSLGLSRQTALWEIRALSEESLPIFDALLLEQTAPPQPPPLPAVPPARQVVQDYQATGVSLRPHPVAFLRRRLARWGVSRNSDLADEQRFPHGSRIAVAGVVLVRQRPSTAAGIVFVTLEDESGVANLILHPRVYERQRKAARHSVMMLVRGRVERQGQVVHVLARQIRDISPFFSELTSLSRDFH